MPSRDVQEKETKPLNHSQYLSIKSIKTVRRNISDCQAGFFFEDMFSALNRCGLFSSGRKYCSNLNFLKKICRINFSDLAPLASLWPVWQMDLGNIAFQNEEIFV